MNRATIATLTFISVVVSLFTAALALAAEELTMSTYAKRIEPICKSYSQHDEDPFAKTANGEARKFTRAGSRLKKTYAELKAVREPKAHEARLTRWLAYIRTMSDLLLRVGRAVRVDHMDRARQLIVDFEHDQRLAYNTVSHFHFRYC